MITNFDLSVQSLSDIEKETFYFIKWFGKTKHNFITIPLTNIAARIGRCTRTVKRILKSLIEKGLIARWKGGRGQASLTKITEKGWLLIKPAAMSPQMSPHMSPQKRIYFRSKSLKGSKIPLSPLPSNVVENKVSELPKLLGEGFVKTAKKVLGKINCALQIKVAKEYDSFAEKQVIRNPIAFLRHKINQLIALEGEKPPAVADKIATEQLKNEIKAKALEMAKDELKRKGDVYPVFIPGTPSAQHFDAVNAYGHRETELYLFYVSKLENENKLTKSNC